jgi:hypothetical protein
VIHYSSSLESLEVLEAWTITPDGRKLVVAPDRMLTKESTDEGRPEFDDQKVRVVIFPAVTQGARLHLRHRARAWTANSPGHAAFPHFPAPDARRTSPSSPHRR